MIVIDTDYVKRYYSNPSQDSNNPTAIDHNSQFMICGSSHGIINGIINGQDSSVSYIKLKFKNKRLLKRLSC